MNAFKMVVIGETGSGKTSFLQLLLNYAQQYGLKNFELRQIKSFVSSETKITTEKKETWDSDTTVSKKYPAKYGTDFFLEIIDTPGFLDTRGSEQEKVNIANIIDIVREERYINCVCLIINGTETRLTEGIKKVLTEIVSILPASVLQNIIVVFTKVRDDLSLNFDIGMLKKFQLSIPDEFIFTIDNPYSRYESLQAHPNKRQAGTLVKDFKTSHETVEEIFAVVKKLKPEMTLKFGEFQEAIENIITSFIKLKTHYRNKEKMLTMISCIGTYESLKKRSIAPKW